MAILTKTKIRQQRILDFLINRGTGIINISNKELSALMGTSEKTIQRDLNEMDNNSIIIRETNLIRQSGQTVKQRDIILKGETPRRFTISQHRQLSNRNNHEIFATQDGEIIWNRRIDSEWQRCFPMKEFSSIKQAYSWLYEAVFHHNKSYTEGDKYICR